MKKLLIALTLILSVQLFANPGVNFKSIQKVAREKFGKTAVIEEKIYDSELSKIYNNKNEVIGYYMTTFPYGKDIIGYAGPTPVLMTFDSTKNIKSTDLLENNETPGFITMIYSRGFFNSWNGVNLSKIGSKKVDTLAGATYTTKAVIQNINKRVKMVTGDSPLEDSKKKK
jgi:Na+-translocating ferredoxin:NAD+ oxidoreductase RnfG subunit